MLTETLHPKITLTSIEMYDHMRWIERTIDTSKTEAHLQSCYNLIDSFYKLYPVEYDLVRAITVRANNKKDELKKTQLN